MDKEVNDLIKALINYSAKYIEMFYGMTFKNKKFKDIIYNVFEEIDNFLKLTCESKAVIPNNWKIPKGATDLDWPDRLKKQIIYLLKEFKENK